MGNLSRHGFFPFDHELITVYHSNATRGQNDFEVPANSIMKIGKNIWPNNQYWGKLVVRHCQTIEKILGDFEKSQKEQRNAN